MAFINNITNADLKVCESAASFLQSAMWGEFKSRFGWKSRAFLIEWKKNEVCPLLLLSRRLAPGFSFAYVPWGPNLPDNFPAADRTAALSELALKLKPLLSRNTTFIRFDPPWAVNDGEDAPPLSSNFKRAAADIQPPDTVIINLSASENEILAAMKSKWRYNISLAGKKGVQVNSCEAGAIEKFYNLLKETAQRDGIAIHSVDYYKTLFDICGTYPERDLSLRLYTASHESDTLAAIVVLFLGETATYLYGASSNIKRNLMAPYALQWKAMRDAKSKGCIDYDLFGIPPDDNPNHPMFGLYQFKTGFGGRIIHRPGSWDFPYKTIVYNLFNFAEAFRKKKRDRKKHIAINPNSKV
jgi:lipid II:glycine glycyltransferase (peptidoglycan interpeptide bridge formation enzyme)